MNVARCVFNEIEAGESRVSLRIVSDYRVTGGDDVRAGDAGREEGEGLVRGKALQVLDERSQRIVRARWLQDDGGATLHDLAAEFGVSAERIRQIEVAAFKKLRVALAPAA